MNKLKVWKAYPRKLGWRPSSHKVLAALVRSQGNPLPIANYGDCVLSMPAQDTIKEYSGGKLVCVYKLEVKE